MNLKIGKIVSPEVKFTDKNLPTEEDSELRQHLLLLWDNRCGHALIILAAGLPALLIPAPVW